MSLLPRARITWPEVAVRAAVALAALLVASALLPPAPARPGYENGYRVPLEAEREGVAGLARHLRSLPKEAGTLTVAFLGASETYGYAVAEDSGTVPVAFASAARRSGVGVRVYNLASRGQQAGDLYVLTKALAGRVDVLMVQLTYANLDPSPDPPRPPRFPDLARELGVCVTPREAVASGMSATPRFDLSAPVRGALDDSGLAARRDRALERVFGGAPEQRLARFLAPVLPDALAEPVAPDEERPPADPFDMQEPAAQMIAVSRFADATTFTVSADDLTPRLLADAAAFAARRGTRVLFFLPPLNAEALEMYGALDEASYTRNVRPVERTLAAGGAPVLDFGMSRLLGAMHFTDMTHTTAEGASVFGPVLLEKAWPLIGPGPAHGPPRPGLPETGSP